jgi:hypothetical protein
LLFQFSDMLPFQPADESDDSCCAVRPAFDLQHSPGVSSARDYTICITESTVKSMKKWIFSNGILPLLQKFLSFRQQNPIRRGKDATAGRIGLSGFEQVLVDAQARES